MTEGAACFFYAYQLETKFKRSDSMTNSTPTSQTIKPPTAVTRLFSYGRLAQLFRFGIVGAIATAVHISVVVSLVESTVISDPLVANIVAFCCAVLVSYFGHNYWTFQHRQHSTKQFARFVLITLSALGLNQIILYVATRLIGLDYKIGLIFVILLVPIFTYFLARLWVFRTVS